MIPIEQKALQVAITAPERLNPYPHQVSIPVWLIKELREVLDREDIGWKGAKERMLAIIPQEREEADDRPSPT